MIVPSWLVIGGVVAPATAGNLLDSARLTDPFATESMTAPAPERPWQAGEPLPQAPEPPKHALPSKLPAVLSLAQLTDLALLHNPATREAWAFARAQAAAPGIARSSYWPHLDALVNLTHSKPISIAGASVPIQTRYGPSVSLAYTLFDFGSRAGAVEAARYRLLAANLLQRRKRSSSSRFLPLPVRASISGPAARRRPALLAKTLPATGKRGRDHAARRHQRPGVAPLDV